MHTGVTRRRIVAGGAIKMKRRSLSGNIGIVPMMAAEMNTAIVVQRLRTCDALMLQHPITNQWRQLLRLRLRPCGCGSGRRYGCG